METRDFFSETSSQLFPSPFLKKEGGAALADSVSGTPTLGHTQRRYPTLHKHISTPTLHSLLFFPIFSDTPLFV